MVYSFTIWVAIFLATGLAEKNESQLLFIGDGEWKQTHFFKYGAPPLTTALKNILSLNTPYRSTPKYEVLKTNFSKEESVYIMVENLTDVLFNFVPVTHPNTSNYTMVPTKLQIQACENNKCEQLKECDRAVVDVSDTNLDENVIFLSWKLSEAESLIILMQYKNKFIKCHRKPHFQINKLVMTGSERQLYGTIDGFFKSTTKENNHINLDRNFNLQVNESVSLHTFQCLDCNTIITLTCDSLQKTVNVSNSQGSKMIFSDNRILNGWKESSLSNCGTQELSNCNLTLQTLLLQSVHQVNNMWIIVQGAAFVNLRNENDKIDSGQESICLKLENDTTVADFEQFEQTPTPIITSTRTSDNVAQSNQTVANYIIKYIKDTSSRTESWLIAIFTLIFVTFLMSAINLYKQWKIVSYSYSSQNLFLLLLPTLL
ncbi:unnamed protein product [Tenebrio molitor]|nr:unnamed protein product [Tenebrio molitor]